jgi:hypothetical protein
LIVGFALALFSSGRASGDAETSATRLAAELATNVSPSASTTARETPAARSDTLVIVYVGETQGNLAPCRCPEQPWGGLARRVGFFRNAHRSHEGALTLLFDTGGFLPSGEVPLRDTPSAARRLTELLLSSFDRAGIDAVALDRGESQFLHGLAPAKASSWENRTLVADPPSAPKWWDWGDRRVAAIALSSTLSDTEVVDACSSVRREADVLIVLARADALDGRRLARLSNADLVLLSRAARPPRPLREGRSWLIGAGGHGREVGEVLLAWTGGSLELVESRLHPMDDSVPVDSVTDEQVRKLLDEEGPGWQAVYNLLP